MKLKLTVFLTSGLLLLLLSCTRKQEQGPRINGGRNVELKCARLLEMEEHDGFTLVRVRNPWDTAQMMSRYVLAEKGRGGVKDSFPGMQFIEVPLERAVIFSAVHNSLMNELGHPEITAGVCDAGYIFEDWLNERLKNGKTADCGTNFQPNVEKIISLKPDAVLLSPYEDMHGNSRISRAGIPVVECAEYMEKTPLGRAEWMRFYGRLVGEGEKSDSLFESTRSRYLELKDEAAARPDRPEVLFDRPYSGKWYVSAGESNLGIMIEDAGGRNPFAGIANAGTDGLPLEKVLTLAGESDIWLIRHDLPAMTYSALAREKEAYGLFKPFRNKNVWETNTLRSHIFEDSSFHPQWLLEELIAVFHCAGRDSLPQLRYFKRLEP